MRNASNERVATCIQQTPSHPIDHRPCGQNPATESCIGPFWEPCGTARFHSLGAPGSMGEWEYVTGPLPFVLSPLALALSQVGLYLPPSWISTSLGLVGTCRSLTSRLEPRHYVEPKLLTSIIAKRNLFSPSMGSIVEVYWLSSSHHLNWTTVWLCPKSNWVLWIYFLFVCV